MIVWRRFHLAGAAAFTYPSAGEPRVALLIPCFRETRRARYFADVESEEARRFDPEVLAGTAEQLRGLASRPKPPVVRNAVVVFTRQGEPGLAEYDRDLFWDIFGVPAFEQYLTRWSRLIATECDAHEGLHVCGPFARRTDWNLDRSPCACGDPRPRLLLRPGFSTPALDLCAQQP